MNCTESLLRTSFLTGYAPQIRHVTFSSLLLIHRLILLSTVLNMNSEVLHEVKPDVLVPQLASERNRPSDEGSTSHGNGPGSSSDRHDQEILTITPGNGDQGKDEDEDITDLDGKNITLE